MPKGCEGTAVAATATSSSSVSAVATAHVLSFFEGRDSAVAMPGGSRMPGAIVKKSVERCLVYNAAQTASRAQTEVQMQSRGIRKESLIRPGGGPWIIVL